MKKTLIIIAAILALAGCAQDATGPESINGLDSGTRDILFTVTGSMKECGYVTYTDATGGSTIIRDCMVPFSVQVDVPEGCTVQITAGKRDASGSLTVMAFEDGESIGYDVALDGDMEAQWIEQ